MLKIDRYLMQGIASDPIRQTIVAKLHEVATTIPAVMVAEGIETLEDLAILRELGIEAGQGYLFARPMPAEQLAELALVRQFGERSGSLAQPDVA